MQQRQSVRDIKAGEEVRSVLLVGAASLQQSRNGPYWRLDLRDASGSVEAKIWSPLSQNCPELSAGLLVDITGRTGLYRDQIQLTVEQIRVLDEAEREELDMADFMPASARRPAEMLAEVQALCRSELTHEPWLRFALSVLEDKDIRPRLLTAPAAKSVHHAYVGGLLEHSLSVAGLCLRMADHYPELDRQTLLAAALFHDIGKLEEMSGGLANDYTDAGRLLGHITQGLLMLEPFLARSGLETDLILHFRHLLVSHHGELEYGSPRQPATAEAFALHYADNMDAKLAQLRGLFPESPPRRQADNQPEQVACMIWSPWQNLLGRCLCRTSPTPSHVLQPVQPVPEEKTQEELRDHKAGSVACETKKEARPAENGETTPVVKEKGRQCSLL